MSNTNNMAAVTADHHGRTQHTTHFVNVGMKWNTGLLGVHVYPPEMSWAKRLVQKAEAAW